MSSPVVFWPAVLGLSFLVAGLLTYRRDLQRAAARGLSGLAVLGPTFIAASLAAFAGEHFTSAANIAQIVPRFMPARLFIAYLVGAAHLAAALSFVTRRYVRWAAIGLAIMFGLFVLLMDLPSAIANPGVRMAWSLAARQATFSLGALALFATVVRRDRPRLTRNIATVARYWGACVLVFYGIENLLYPQFAPGVPSTVPTAAWVPLPHVIAWATGIILVACGLLMFIEKFAATGAALCGVLMTVLTVALFAPQFFLEHDAGGQLTAINFVFDTLLFAGTAFVISGAISATACRPAGATSPVAHAT
ncbi:MAG TPA: hypothetical protein VFK13_09680 [Gemmatimonadaceae bacterium]|nr:hypothetical protein [Gemmatimonadaceae bacterium]